MTSSTPSPKWAVIHLALLVCWNTAWLVEGYPHASTEEPPNGSSSKRQVTLSISKLIETAYNNNELVAPAQWFARTDDKDQTTEQTQRDAMEQLEPSNDETMQYRKRKLLEVSSSEISMHRHSDEIVFPDGTISSSTLSSMTLPAPSCHKSTFCENVVDYPRHLINQAIARNASLRFLESVDPMPDIEQRIDATDESPLCQYREQVVYPQTAQNKAKEWLFIVNQDNLKQGIRIEVCLNDGQECNLIDGFAEGYKTTCKQKYIYRELAAVGSNGNIIKDQFRFPSSCCCHVRFTGDPTVRIGLGLDLQPNRTLRTQYK
ncbi:hypothetical protein P5V15_000053 [Pogonomyrmex californicus]